MNEIETWISKGSEAVIEYDAQLALLYATGKMTIQEEQTELNIEVRPFQLSSILLLTCLQEGKASLESYLSILRSASTDDSFSAEEREILLITISECEEESSTQKKITIKVDYRAQLRTLHGLYDGLFDGYVARHSVEMAIQVCISGNNDAHCR